MEELVKARQQARKKICQQITQINQQNKAEVDRKLGRILSLKKNKIKEVDARDSHTIYFVDLHKSTHHYPHCTKFLLDYVANIRAQCNYLEIAFSDHNNWNTLQVYLFWHEFINDCTGTSSYLADMQSQDDISGIRELLAEMTSRNEAIVETQLNCMLKNKNASMLGINDQKKIFLTKHTFKSRYTRQEYRRNCITLRQKYPFVEIFHLTDQQVVLRVWWQIYLNPMESGDVQLEEDEDSPPRRLSRSGLRKSGDPTDTPAKKKKSGRFQSIRQVAGAMVREIIDEPTPGGATGHPTHYYPSTTRPESVGQPNTQPDPPSYQASQGWTQPSSEPMSTPKIYYPKTIVPSEETGQTNCPVGDQTRYCSVGFGGESFPPIPDDEVVLEEPSMSPFEKHDSSETLKKPIQKSYRKIKKKKSDQRCN